MDSLEVDINFIEQATYRIKLDVMGLQAHAEAARTRLLQVEQDRDKDKDETRMLKTHLKYAETRATFTGVDKDKIERELYSMRAWLFGIQQEMLRREALEARPTESIDVQAVYRDARPQESQRACDSH
ncbi:hypothetical protein Tco_1097038 [Tanacetum coccineum]